VSFGKGSEHLTKDEVNKELVSGNLCNSTVGWI